MHRRRSGGGGVGVGRGVRGRGIFFADTAAAQNFLFDLPPGEYDRNHDLSNWTSGDLERFDSVIRDNSVNLTGLVNHDRIRAYWRRDLIRARPINMLINVNNISIILINKMSYISYYPFLIRAMHKYN